MAWNVLGRIWEGFGKLTPARGAPFPVLLHFSIRFPCIGKTCSTPNFYLLIVGITTIIRIFTN